MTCVVLGWQASPVAHGAGQGAQASAPLDFSVSSSQTSVFDWRVILANWDEQAQAKRTECLEQLGSAAAEEWSLVLADWSVWSAQARRALAEQLSAMPFPFELDAGADSAAATWDFLEVLVADVDPDVRRAGLDILTEPVRKGSAAFAELAARRFGAMARFDSEPGLRLEAGFALASMDRQESVKELALLLKDLPTFEAERTARRLSETSAGRSLMIGWVKSALIADSDPSAARRGRLPFEVLNTLLRFGYADALTASPEGGLNREDRLPYVLAQTRPELRLSVSANLSLQRLIGRLVFLGQAQRADKILESLGREGWDPTDVWMRRARLALQGQTSAAHLELAANALKQLSGEIERGEEAALLGFQGALLATYGALLESDLERASQKLDQAESVLRYARGAGLSRRVSTGLGAQALTDHGNYARLSLVEILRVLIGLLEGRELQDRDLMRTARKAHLALLKAQWAAGGEAAARTAQAAQKKRADPEGTDSAPQGVSLATYDSWNAVLFDHDFAPLWLFEGGHGTMSGSASLELLEDLFRVLASVAPEEFPGLQEIGGLAPGLSNPLADPERLKVLKDVRWSRLRGFELELRGLPADSPRRAFLRRRLDQAWREMNEDERRGFPALRSLRNPSSAGLRLANLLREGGQPSKARELTLAMRKDLDQASGLGSSLSGQYLSAQLESSLGASFSDEDEPVQAEEMLLRAEQRMQEMERELELGGLDGSFLSAERANILVSLAVNANVKLGDPERALEYFEKAFELRQSDDWMRVLLACYRARAGRQEEAREILAELALAPATYYNAACSYALLGDVDAALDYLERDFRHNHPSGDSLARQKRWAAEDPDLSSLRKEPRFQALVQP